MYFISRILIYNDFQNENKQKNPQTFSWSEHSSSTLTWKFFQEKKAYYAKIFTILLYDVYLSQKEVAELNCNYSFLALFFTGICFSPFLKNHPLALLVPDGEIFLNQSIAVLLLISFLQNQFRSYYIMSWFCTELLSLVGQSILWSKFMKVSTEHCEIMLVS